MPQNESSRPAVNSLMIFTDGSVDVKTGIGYGACLLVPGLDMPLEELKENIQVKRFENTSSTRLELETLLWALDGIPYRDTALIIYTDSQNIIGLRARRKRLEQADYRSKNNRLIKNHDLYKAFFEMTDSLNYTLIKAKGHQPSIRKDMVHRLFTLVDKASRNALRLSDRE